MPYRLTGRSCRAPGCVRPVFAKGLCRGHWNLHGRPQELTGDEALRAAADATARGAGVERLVEELLRDLDAWGHDDNERGAA